MGTTSALSSLNDVSQPLVQNTPLKKVTFDDIYLGKGLVPCRCNPKEYCSLCNGTGYRKPRQNSEKPKAIDAKKCQRLILEAQKKMLVQKAVALRVQEEAKEQRRAQAEAEQKAFKRRLAKEESAKSLATERQKGAEEAKRMRGAARRAWQQNPRLVVAQLLVERIRKLAPVRLSPEEEQMASNICHRLIKAEMLIVNKLRSKYQATMSDLALVKVKSEKLKAHGTNANFWGFFALDADRLHRELGAGMAKWKPPEHKKGTQQNIDHRVAQRLQREQKHNLTNGPKSGGRLSVPDLPNGGSMCAAFDDAYQNQKVERELDGASGMHVFRDHGQFGSHPSFDASDPDE